MRRKTIGLSLLLGLLLSIFIAGTSASTANAASNSVIRVKLSVGNKTSVSVFLDGNYSVKEDSSIKLERQLYTIKISNDKLYLYYGNSKVYSGSSITLIQQAATKDYNNFIWLNNYEYGYRSYLGNFEFAINNDNYINVINHVYLEDYLYGVVPYEMSDSWPIEALKSQAVAARNYAVKSMNSSASYDVVDTPANQVYKGYSSSNSNAIQAVNSTAKKILTFNSSVISTYYSASNGGWTDIPYHVWGGGYDMDYYVIGEDTYDANNSSSLYEGVFIPHSFSSTSDLTTADNVDGTPNTANLIKYIKQTIVSTGALSSYGVDSRDDFDLIGADNFNMYSYDSGGSENHSRMPKIGVNNCVDFTKLKGDFTVMVNGEEKVVEDLSLDLNYLDASNGTTTYQVFNSSSLRLFLTEEDTVGGKSGYWIYQKRYGHGVGMSQRGAQARANAGKSYSEILSFYYKNTTLSALSITKPTLASATTTDNTNSTVINVSSSLNIRNAASTSSTILGTVPNGARIEVMQLNVVNGWHSIMYGGSIAYVYADYVSFDTNNNSYTITAKTDNSAYGSVSGNGTYANGATVTLTATPISGYKFLYWQEDDITVSKDFSYSFTASKNRTVTAYFSKIGTPTLTVSTAKGYNSIQLNWTKVWGASGYHIYRSTSETSGYELIKTTAFLNFTNIGLTDNKTYYYKVRAYINTSSGKSYGGYSEVRSAKPLLIKKTTLTSVSSAGYNSIKLNWAKISGVSGYKIYRSTSKTSGYKLIKTTTSLSYTNTGLTNGKTYYYKVRACYNAASTYTYGSYSDIKSAKPLLGKTSLAAKATSYNSIKLSWNKIPEAKGYIIYRATSSGGTYSKVATVKNATSYTNTRVKTNKIYYYKVRAYRSTSSGNVYRTSNVVSAKAYLSKTSLTAKATSYNSIKLSWTKVPKATGYIIYRATSSGGTYSKVATVKNATSYTNTRVKTNKTYYYKIRTYVATSSGNIYRTSNIVSSKAYLSKTSLTAKATSYNSIKLSWTKVPKATGYIIYRATSSGGTYSKVATVKSSTSYTNTRVKTNKTYYYKIRTYVATSSGNIYRTSNIVSAKAS